MDGHPRRQGLAAAMSWKRAGKAALPAVRETKVPFLQRLAQRFEDAPGELGPLVQGRHSLIRCTGSRAFGLSSHEASQEPGPSAGCGSKSARVTRALTPLLSREE